MKLVPLLLALFFLASCSKQYLYRFPSEAERRPYHMDDLKWSYTGSIPDTITVTDGKFVYKLPVTDQTKLEVHTTSGEKYRFALQSIAITEGREVLGPSETWRGYDILSHAERTVTSREIAIVVVMSDTRGERVYRR